MPETGAYEAAVNIGARIRHREYILILIITIIVVTASIVSVYVQERQAADLRQASALQLSRNAERLIIGNRDEILILAAERGARCVLTIPPNAKRTFTQKQRLIDRCYTTFDHLDRQGHP